MQQELPLLTSTRCYCCGAAPPIYDTIGTDLRRLREVPVSDVERRTILVARVTRTLYYWRMFLTHLINYYQDPTIMYPNDLPCLDCLREMREETEDLRPRVVRLRTENVPVLITVYRYQGDLLAGMEGYSVQHKIHQAGCGLLRRWNRAQETVFNGHLMREE